MEELAIIDRHLGTWWKRRGANAQAEESGRWIDKKCEVGAKLKLVPTSEICSI